jgi:hypothetical protein
MLTLCRKKPPESTQKMKKTPFASKVNDPRMFEEENVYDSELGDMGDSDDEGAEADIHNEGVSLKEVLESSNEPIGDDADKIDDLKGEEFSPAEGNGVVQLVGATDGWVPPGPPPTGGGVTRKHRNMPKWGDDGGWGAGELEFVVAALRDPRRSPSIAFPPEKDLCGK